MSSLQSLIPQISNVKVSSTLNRNAAEFGKLNMFDGTDDTCWNSHQGSPQSVLMEFDDGYVVKEVHIMFQGGFVGKSCQIFVKKETENASKGKMEWLRDFYPTDDNSLQRFEVDCEQPITHIKLVFLDSTDFYGRITIYQVDALGMVDDDSEEDSDDDDDDDNG